MRFRDDPDAIGTVLRRFGAFDDPEIKRVCNAVPGILEPAKVWKSATFPELDVDLADEMKKAKLRFVLFAAEQRRSTPTAGPFVFGDDLLAFVWECFRPEQQRQRSAARYNYELWGPQFARMVRYFKDSERAACDTIQELYRWYET